jgi:isocitrate/isopropylmalate dehydrogenase
LRHGDERLKSAADSIETAVEQALTDPSLRSRDIGGSAKSASIVSALLSKLN